MDHADLALLRDLEKDSSLWPQLLCEAFVKINRGFWNDAYVSMIMDRWGGGLTFGDVYCFVQIHSMLCSGRAIMTKIELGEAPFNDKHVKENNELLNELPSPFGGEFWGGVADSDGYIAWNRPIQANVVFSDGSEKGQSIAVGQAPLEVGYTSAFTTLQHLRGERCIARWPYDSTAITLMHLIEPIPISWAS
jgi:hypothetical protein